jgi:hypothetical protein
MCECCCKAHPYLCSAGPPVDNDTVYCPLNQTSCYFYYSTSLSIASATTKCTAMGGYLVSYGNMAENRLIEGYFLVGGTAAATSATVPPVPPAAHITQTHSMQACCHCKLTHLSSVFTWGNLTQRV